MVFETVKGLANKRINKSNNIHQKCLTTNKDMVNYLFNKGKKVNIDIKDSNVNTALNNLFDTMSIVYKDDEHIKKF